MSAGANTPQIKEYFLNSGYIYVPLTPTLISTVLGSCVAVCVWDRKREYGGMNHFLYPSTQNPKEATAKFGNVATKTLIRLFLDEGSKRENLEAQIFGGANPPKAAPDFRKISRDNIAVARSILHKSRIPIISEDVGGERGRKLVFNSLTGEIIIIRAERLRESDWYPYEGGRN
jgi:chemotaxis protein CheD